MEKLVVVIMGQNCEKFIGMCLDSVKDADAIVFCDGGSEDDSIQKIFDYAEKFGYNGGTSDIAKDIELNLENGQQIEIIRNKYNQKDKGMNGKQRNFYLDYIKKNYMGWFCLAIDTDEVVEDLSKIKNFLTTIPKDKQGILFCVKMRHFIKDLGQEDATQPEHFVPNRLFKIRKELFYQEVEHPVLVTDEIMKNMDKLGDYMKNIQPTTIWHLRECTGIFNTLEKHKWNMEKSEMHSKEELTKWYHKMLFGYYPTSIVRYTELPDAIKKEFLLK